MHIAICGNIGVGKTTLTDMLAQHYNWKAYFEDVYNNPYLEDFYFDMSKWSFALQIYFLGHRFKQIKEIQEDKKNIIQDRSIYEDAVVFTKNLHEMQLLSERDFNNYNTIFELMKSFVSPPDLLIYLRASVPNLVKNIYKRGREFENSISIEYLSKLNDKYENWIQNYTDGKLLIIEVDDLDFVEKPEDFGFILEKINAELYGLF